MRAKYASNVDFVTPCHKVICFACLSAISHVAGCLDDAKHVITRSPSHFMGNRLMALSQTITVDSDMMMQLKLREKREKTNCRRELFVY